MSKDLYNILGISRDASDSEIKKAYRKIALKCHPDRQAGKSEEEKKKAEEDFKEATKAYEVLKDPEKKSRYDRFGTIDDNNSQGFSGFDMGDIFKDMGFTFDMSGFNPFGTRSSGQYRKSYEKGQSIQVNLHVTMEDIYNGIDKDISYDRKVKCQHCHGHGGSGHHVCQHCHGTGQIVNTQRNGYSMIQQISTCPYCNGTGEVVDKECNHCHGTGFDTKRETIHVKLGSPVEGAKVSYKNMGNEPKGEGENGDLFVVIVYDNEINKYGSKYQVDRFGNVTETLSVPYYTCILGGEVETELPNHKKIKVKIPEYADNGTQIRLNGKGMHGHDYIFNIKVKMPTYVNKNEKEMLEKIKKENK